MPLAWLMLCVVRQPWAVVYGLSNSHALMLFCKTVFLALSSAAIACALAIVPAFAIAGSTAQHRVFWRVLLWVPLLLPTHVLGYGWGEWLVRLGQVPYPQGVLDHLRCVLILSTWVWPVPCAVMVMTLNHLERDLIDQARLDGAVRRIIARRLFPSMLGGLALATLLTVQEFAVFEMTGISVLATELRMIFETGRFSDASNPISLLQGGVSSGAGLAADQMTRVARSIGAASPVLIGTIFFVLIGQQFIYKQRDTFEDISSVAHITWPGQRSIAWLIVLISLAMPISGLIISLPRGWRGVQIIADVSPQLQTSFILAASVAGVCFVLACASAIIPHRVISRRWLPGVLGVCLLSFLVGGQFIAIALLRLFSDDPVWLGDLSPLRLILDTDVAVVMAHVARFGWIALLAGVSTHAGAYRLLRQQAAIDGATGWQSFVYIIFPRAGRMLVGAAICCGTLSLTETAAATLLTPNSIIPMMMTWVHRQQYGPMIELSLVVVILVVIASIVIQGLVTSLKLKV
jgi:ABC-type Fe3+ transport system permease subunit